MMGDLSANFSRHEFRCLGEFCCGNSAPVHPELLTGLQELRNIAGVPIKLSCGFRCRKHNKEIQGAEDSYHILGMAADVIVPESMSPEEFAYLAECVNQFRNGGIGVYKTHIHVDVREERERW